MSTLVPARTSSIDEYGITEPTSTYDHALNNARVRNPFVRGEEVIIPKGTLIKTMEPGRNYKRAGRTYKVRITGEFYGHADLYERSGVAILPTITWPGRGGYWHDVQVTKELAAANGRELADFVMTEEEARALNLPVIPSWEDGYTDKWSEANA